MNHIKAASALTTGWGIWITSHIAELNSVLQAIAFLAAIVCSICAAQYYIEARREKLRLRDEADRRNAARHIDTTEL